jgi:hypothetical protein
MMTLVWSQGGHEAAFRLSYDGHANAKRRLRASAVESHSSRPPKSALRRGSVECCSRLERTSYATAGAIVVAADLR